MIKSYWKQVVAFFVVAASLISCSTVPITGRSQLSLFPSSQMAEMGLTNYNSFLKEAKLSDNKEQTDMVKRVGTNIANAVEKYMKDHGYESQLANFDWEFNLVEDDTPNAWCMPGGKVVFYTGILPYTKNEDGLAVVMGHEIAHAVAKHGNERMSHAMGVQAVAAGLQVALQEKPQQTQQIYMAAFGLGAQYGMMLPYSRKHEYEADKMGLIFMSMAGYNPEEAVDFWTRMSQMGGQKPPEFMSTHPADESRIKQIEANMAEAKSYAK
ncbi:M48 family metallopeptidase [Plebeiibacterium marinum]|uniref:M48 family metallopeptidase n=1 Tax=Plebeiibacterium marinum TaxID=2992111 RepID=A0AAE3MBJ8_9BACT|nr:M48 family metallopeptidase [Plebeiobacterium marinum]MCW3804675.1 M48 family metallopeptidase [Plebeiobacterium marinum]